MGESGQQPILVDLFPARQLTYPRDLTSEVASASASRLRLRIHYRSRSQTLHNYLVYIACFFPCRITTSMQLEAEH